MCVIIGGGGGGGTCKCKCLLVGKRCMGLGMEEALLEIWTVCVYILKPCKLHALLGPPSCDGDVTVYV